MAKEKKEDNVLPDPSQPEESVPEVIESKDSFKEVPFTDPHPMLPPEAEPEDGTEVEQDSSDDDQNELEDEPAGPNKLQLLAAWFIRHKKRTIPVTLILLLAVVFGIPASRYAVLGLVVKKSYVVAVVDAQSNLPVSEATVEWRGKTAKTDVEGKVRLNGVRVGPGQLKVTKKYYKDSAYQALAPLPAKQDIAVRLEPTGRQVPIKTVNKITGKAVAGAVLKVADTQIKTDENGEAIIVLPAASDVLDGELSGDTFNTQKVRVKVSQLANKENTYQMVPAGKIYYLSKRTGKINVMKSDLDGANAQVGVEATGNESEDDTVLLASRDWKHMALKARREGGGAKVYLLEADTDKLTEIDGGKDTAISLVGWSGQHLVYQVTRSNVSVWQGKRKALKSFDATSKQIKVLDDSIGEGVNDNDFIESDVQAITILADRIVYTYLWQSGYYSSSRLEGKKHAIISVKPDGSNRQTLKDFDAKTVSYINSTQPELSKIYYRAYSGTTRSFYTYKDGKIADDSELTDEKFDKSYPTYLVSPTGESTFWSEPRDGKNTLIVGGASGANGNEILAMSDLLPYGWYSDNYVLVSKNSSELFVMPSNGLGSSGQIIKITDYHKPAINFYGYGFGYGGL